ncbi:K(+) efflux antiporter 2, chloroplastic-like [Actinidia eriantha]|uniref:K(+) efflux antiporter 2, chloroplastic-like n=1 Tax=Actinidia eriantha TaxID=165200 RepID=UPI002586A822|nr:K(+) efflux antiporter 2, chloroplastic-like [Actinidia eriantha]XP_057496281.1 K(+) efflux antiporter 2, chloroplastic-like [Actinidia eriantha]
MDFACSFRQPNLFQGCESTSCRTLDRFNSHLKFRIRGIGCNFHCNPRKLKLKKIGASTSGVNLGVLIKRDLNSHLWGYNSCGHLTGDFVNDFKKLRGVRSRCQGSDSIAYIDGNGRNVESVESHSEESLRGEANVSPESNGSGEVGEDKEGPTLDELRELFQMALKELEVARLNSIMFEEKAQRISEAAIALKDEAANARDNVDSTLDTIQEILNEETGAKEAVQKATMALSLAEARLQVVVDSLEAAKGKNDLREASGESESGYEGGGKEKKNISKDEEEFFVAQDDIRACRATLEHCEGELLRLQSRKEELQKEVDRLNEVAEKVQMNALKAEEDVANVMLLAEQAVAFEIEAAQHVGDAEIALQRAEASVPVSHVDGKETVVHQNGSSSQGKILSEEELVEEGKVNQGGPGDIVVEMEIEVPIEGAPIIEPLPGSQLDGPGRSFEEPTLSNDSDQENGRLSFESSRDNDIDSEKTKNVTQTKKQELQKDLPRDSSPLNVPKALLKKSSRFFSASFFSLEGSEFTPASLFNGLIESARKELPKFIVGSLLIGAGVAFYAIRAERIKKLFLQPDIITTSIDEVSSNAKPLVRQIRNLPNKVKKLVEMLPHQEVNEEEASLFDMLWLLLASVVFVPIFQKIPGGSPVLGYLAAGILIGPYGLSIIRHVHGTKAIAEFGVVFLLFNIGLELSVERLSSMKKYVFGLGTAQVLVTAVVVGLVARFVAGQASPAALVIGNGLALSSTAVVLQVLQERGESTSRHGRATFSVLLFQDLAVVVLLILIPLISPNSSKGGVGFQAIAEALGLAAVKAIVAITAIIAGGRLLLRPIYKQIAENQNAEIFSANTLLVILGTSLLTARAGLSMALGAFLAGLLLAETEFSLQVESDIAPYRGLLLGLFFMTVGMSIDPKLLISNFPAIMGTLGLLIGGKTLLVAVVGKLFGISIISAIRVGLLLAPGGEFAFVAFGEAVNQGIMSPQLSSLLFLVVGISMALTPWLAAGGQLIASRFELHDVRSLLPAESETDDLQDHIIICGFGRVGQIIAQLLSERLIPFVALDVRSDRVAVGRALDLPVYFGDAGSREVLHKVGAERASAAAITLDSPGANYRTVWALSKHFPNVKTFVRAHDIDHGINLEKAGATAVVPETLEPSLQLAAAVLAQAKLPMSEIASAINEFRSRHLSELAELCEESGSSLGYGYSRMMTKPKSQPSDTSDENQVTEGTLAI